LWTRLQNKLWSWNHNHAQSFLVLQNYQQLGFGVDNHECQHINVSLCKID
jgi:hypothetical protein